MGKPLREVTVIARIVAPLMTDRDLNIDPILYAHRQSDGHTLACGFVVSWFLFQTFLFQLAFAGPTTLTELLGKVRS